MPTAARQTLPPAGYLPPRVVVWDVPDLEALRQACSELFPEAQRWHTVSLDLTAPNAGLDLPRGELGLLLFISGVPSSLDKARFFLRKVVHPLLYQQAKFTVGFQEPREQIMPSSLTLEDRWQLDIEDGVRLLEEDAVPEHFSRLHLLRTKVALTPIEEQLASALERAPIKAEPQVRFGRFTVDFLVRENGSQFAIEADGATHHDATRDARRDAELRELGVTDVLRFTGSEIYRDADGCASRVKACLQGVPNPLRPSLQRQTLDESQDVAVKHAGGAARVLAPAGAGKTRVLVDRIAELIERGVEPASILALAFNKKAEEQMADCLRKDAKIGVAQYRVYDPADPGVRVLTFNAFGKRTLDELFGYKPKPEPDSAKLRNVMEHALGTVGITLSGFPRGSDPLRQFLRARDRVVADLRPARSEMVELERINDGVAVIPYKPINDAFASELIRRGMCAFDDQIGDAVRMLLDNRDKRLLVQNFFTHVLVDEFQDLNASQLALVDIVSRPHAQLFVVGDDDQMIYGWRYASLSNILDFEDRHPGAATYVLSTNYRCSASVVRASQRVIDRNRNRVPKSIEPKPNADPGMVAYSVSPVLEERLSNVAEFVKNSRARAGAWRKIAVLCRYKSQQPLVALALDLAEIPRTPLLKYRLFSDPAAVLLRSYLALLLDPDQIDGDSLARLLNKPNRYVPNQLEQRLRSSQEPWQELLAEVDRRSADAQNAYRWRAVREGLIERTTSLRNEVMAKNTPPANILDRIMSAFELERYWTDASERRRDADENDPLSLVLLLQLHASDHSSAADFARYWDEQCEEEMRGEGTERDTLSREVDDSEDRVVIGTIHTSKGREYDATVVFDFDVPLERLEHHQVEEERRVFYVGMTRAKDRLLITADSNRRVHPFILESIRDEERAERPKLTGEKAMLRDSKYQAIVDQSKARDALERYESGAERRRLIEELAPHRRHVASLERQLEKQRTWLETSSLIDALLGRRRKARAVLAGLQHEHSGADAAAEQINNQIRVMETDPAHFTDPLVETVDAAAKRITALDSRLGAIADRESELELLESGSAAPTPDVANLRGRKGLSRTAANSTKEASGAPRHPETHLGWG